MTYLSFPHGKGMSSLCKEVLLTILILGHLRVYLIGPSQNPAFQII